MSASVNAKALARGIYGNNGNRVRFPDVWLEERRDGCGTQSRTRVSDASDTHCLTRLHGARAVGNASG
jgi:hypothetical protein